MYRTIEAVALNPDGKIAISASWDESLRVWDVASGACLRTLREPSDEVFFTGRLRDAWRTRTKLAHKESPEVTAGVKAQFPTETRNSNAVVAVTFTPDGTKAVSTKWDKSFHVWDTLSGNCLLTHQGRSVPPNLRKPTEEYFGVALTPEGRTAVLASGEGNLDVWDIMSGKRKGTLECTSRLVERVVLTPDGRRAVSAGYDKTLSVWDLGSGLCLRKLSGHTEDVNNVVVTYDGKIVIAASDDHSVRVWDLASGECLAIYYAGAPVKSLSEVRPDGRFACGTADGQVHFLSLRKIRQPIPIVTAVRLWCIDIREGLSVPKSSEPLYPQDHPLLGRYDGFVTTVCAWCAIRFRITSPVLDTITGCMLGLAPDQSPWLALSAKAWEDPGLLSPCANCHRPLKFNPFLVDSSR